MNIYIEEEHIFQGSVVPESVHERRAFDCSNSYCAGINCEDCIHSTIGLNVLNKEEYLEGLSDDEF